MSGRRRVLILMPGHLSTTPRMLKAADSLAAAGYDVRVISAGFLEWAREADRRTAATRTWRWQTVEHGSEQAPFLHGVSGARRHLARSVARVMGTDAAPFWSIARALSRVHDELISQALSQPFDFVYGGSTGGLAAVAEVARRRGVPFAVDLEDLHTAESVAPDAALHHGLARRVLHRVLPAAAFVTTSTGNMADCYRDAFGVTPVVLHNVFPLPDTPPVFERAPGPLRVYWFSQTIGPGRGIEDALVAIRMSGRAVDLTLRGRSSGSYVADLQRQAADIKNLVLHIAPPGDPDRMIALCAGHDVGLSTEHGDVENKEVCLGNKVFTYLLAGLPVALSDTRAQRCLATQLGDAALLYSPGDPRAMAEWFTALSANNERIARHRHAAWAAASGRWHWEHEAEEGKLLSLVEHAAA